MDKSALEGYLGNGAGVKNVIDVLRHDKSEKMPYKTGYTPRWVFVVLGFVRFGNTGRGCDMQGKAVKNLQEKMLAVWCKFYVSAKGVFGIFAENAKAVGFGIAPVPAYCGHGSFLANFCMRGRKPRHFSSETAFCLLVTPFAKAFVPKGFEDIGIPPSGHWSFPAGHLTENRTLGRICEMYEHIWRHSPPVAPLNR